MRLALLTAVSAAVVACGPAPERQTDALGAVVTAEVVSPPVDVSASIADDVLSVSWGMADPVAVTGFRLFLDEQLAVDVAADARTHVFQHAGGAAERFVQVQALHGDLVSAPVGVSVRGSHAATSAAPPVDDPGNQVRPSAAPPSSNSAAPPAQSPAAVAPPSGAVAGGSASNAPSPGTDIPAAPVTHHTLRILVAPGGAVVPPGEAAGNAGCVPEDFQPGDLVRITSQRGQVLREGALGACQRIALAVPGIGAITSLRMYATLPDLPVGEPEMWTVTVGSRSWTVSTAVLARYQWSISVSGTGISPGPVGSGPGPGGGGFNLGGW